MGRFHLPMHGRTHVPGGSDPIPGLSLAAGGFYATSPQTIPLLYGASWNYDGFAFTSVAADADNVVPGGWIRTNSGTQNAYFTIYVTLGPQGSHWALIGGWKAQADGGIITVSLANVTETAGVLSDTPPGSYVSFSTRDIYNATTSFNEGLIGDFIIDGADGTLLTDFSTGTDSEQHMDGGSGVYSLKVSCSTKNASSSGYRAELYGLAFVRLNDSDDFLGGF